MTAVDARAHRNERIMQSAFDCFSKGGIDTIALTDIAEKAEIGIASLYRYFPAKEDLAIKCAIWAWKKQQDVFSGIISEAGFSDSSGFRQLEKICSIFETLVQESREFLRFIYFFDSYIVRNGIQNDRLSDYEAEIKTVQTLIQKAIHKGLEDGSIKLPEGSDESQIYFTMMHSLFSMAQKISVSGGMLKMNDEENKQIQMRLLTKLLLDSIKGTN